MALEDARVIDAAGIENDTGFAVLTIADAWDWRDVQRHLLALQDKLNSYFEFIESGQIVEAYPPAAGRRVVIDIVGRFPVPVIVDEFLERANQTAAALDVVVRHRVVSV